MCLASPVFVLAAGRNPSYEQYLANLHAEGKERVIVKFKNAMTPDLVGKHKGKVIRSLSIVNAIVCEIPREEIEHLRQEHAIECISEDIIIQAPEALSKGWSAKPNRSLQPERRMAREAYESAEGSRRRTNKIVGSYNGTAQPAWENLEAGLNAKAAWDRYGLDGTGVKVAFLDTGINYGADPSWPLPDLDHHYLGGYNFVDDDAMPMPYIDPTDPDLTEWHGTTIAANCLGEGESKVVGMAYNASYYALRILSGPQATGPLSNALAALEWCMDPDGDSNTTSDRPDIINMSFCAYASETNPDVLLFKAACDVAHNAGIVLVAASGNDGYAYSALPASFDNVISVGGHAEDQTLLYREIGSTVIRSNGGVDFVAPGEYLAALSPEGIVFHGSGTSGAAACTSGLIALQLQYARLNNIQPNNGYLWEVMKHSAKDMPLITDPNYRGKGKIWAADTSPTPPDLGDGSIDCMAARWPLSFAFEYPGSFSYYGHPSFYIGTAMSYEGTLTNNTATVGNYSDDIANMNVTVKQVYHEREAGAALPGDSTDVFPGQSVTVGSAVTLSDSYVIQPETIPGMNQTFVDCEFQFAGDTRWIHWGYGAPSGLWVAREVVEVDYDRDGDVDGADFDMFESCSSGPGIPYAGDCAKADLDPDGDVDQADFALFQRCYSGENVPAEASCLE